MFLRLIGEAEKSHPADVAGIGEAIRALVFLWAVRHKMTTNKMTTDQVRIKSVYASLYRIIDSVSSSQLPGCSQHFLIIFPEKRGAIGLAGRGR
jgi:hypothetical protein